MGEGEGVGGGDTVPGDYILFPSQSQLIWEASYTLANRRSLDVWTIGVLEHLESEYFGWLPFLNPLVVVL